MILKRKLIPGSGGRWRRRTLRAVTGPSQSTHTAARSGFYGPDGAARHLQERAPLLELDDQWRRERPGPDGEEERTDVEVAAHVLVLNTHGIIVTPTLRCAMAEREAQKSGVTFSDCGFTFLELLYVQRNARG